MLKNLIRCRVGVLIAAMPAALLWSAAASAAPPANDAFAAAVQVTTPFSAAINLADSTIEPDEPLRCPTAVGTVWYRIESGAAQTLRVALPDVRIEVFADVYRATESALSLVSGIGGCFPAASNEVILDAVAGDVIYVQVGRLQFPFPVGTQLDVDVIPPPANDDFASPTPITALPFAETVDTATATIEPDEPPVCTPSPSDNSVWYAYTPAADQSITATAGGAGLGLYVGGSLPDLTPLGCLYGGPLTFVAEAGTTYLVQLGRDPSGGPIDFNFDVAAPPVAQFVAFPGDPSAFDTISFFNQSFDPGGTALTATWEFGDGPGSSELHPSHRFLRDGDYVTTLTVTTTDGRSASTSQPVTVRTHDVQITKFNVPDKARAGMTERITIGVSNRRSAETVEVVLYKSVVGGDFIPVESAIQSVPVGGRNKTTDYRLNYTFTADDAAATKVTFKAVATIMTGRDALPADNTALSFPVRVRP